MKELVFLPDRDGRDDIGGAMGFVRVGSDAGALRSLADRLVSPRAQHAAAENDTAWRSALTLALLTDVWEGCSAETTVLTITGDTSPFAAWVLASRPEAERGKPVHLVMLEKGGCRRLLGIADAVMGVRLPATPSALHEAAPARAAWIDRENGGIEDPARYLSECDREILLRRMEALALTAPAALSYMEALRNADAEEEDAVRMQDEAALEHLAVRMEAFCGLREFEAFSIREERYAAGGNALLRCLGAVDAGLESRGGYTCLWNGVPFARSSRVLGLTGTGHPGEAMALEEITAELTMMSSGSVRWNHTTGKALQQWLDEKGNALIPQARERLERSCAVLEDNGRQVQSAVTLTWPWNAGSGAVRALLMETLGEEWLKAAEHPFSDRLTKMTGYALGDTALGVCCACADGVLLPPLSQELAACAARQGAESGLALDSLRFQPQEDGGITASFLLRGTGEIRMVRRYSAEEILVLTEDESPSVAVWPCLPMADWRAYHVFVRGATEVAAMGVGGWESLPVPAEMPDGNGPERKNWRCLRVAEYPACLSILRDGLCLGALPNMLPPFRVEKQGDVVVGVDFGSSRIATAYAWNGTAQTMEGQMLTRCLSCPQNAQEDAFLASLTPASATPAAMVLTGPGDQPFTDGYALRPESIGTLVEMDAQNIRARLKWRSDAESVRARRILLHQVMLGAALTAMCAGAVSIAWRLTIADEMGDEGREDMLSCMKDLSEQVAEESGLPLTAGIPAVVWAEESAALCACLRAEGAGRGSCIAADFGSSGTKMHLWLQNQSRPAGGAVIFEGVQDVLLRFYRAQPVRLLEDLGDCGNEALLADAMAIVDQMNPDLAGQRQADKLLLMLDMLLDTHRVAIGQHMSARAAAGRPTFMQAILLETEAASLFCAGLMLAQAGDNPMISHLLPEDIPVCLSGRGAWLMETLPIASRNALQHLIRSPLRLDHPVRFVTLRMAARPVQSVALGLSVTRETGRIADAPLLRSRESFSALMLRLMQQLTAAFPMHMWLLHEGLFDWQSGAMTPAGNDSVRRAAARCYDPEEELTACVAAFVRTLRESPILPDHMTESGA